MAVPADLDAPVNDRVQTTATLVAKQDLGADYWVLTLHVPGVAQVAGAGQFVLVAARPIEDGQTDPLLLRPFSFLSRDPDAGTVELFLRVVGRGTDLMTRWPLQARVNCLGPLGGRWPMPGDGPALLVAGGVGMPPLLDLAVSLRSGPREVHVFYGGRSAEHIHLVDRFEAAGAFVHVCTDDGSLGQRGTNVAALEAWIADHGVAGATIYGCGPEAMLRALAASEAAGAAEHNWVSMEAPMACGIGVCRGCAVPHRDGGYRMVCVDGPVFEASEMFG